MSDEHVHPGRVAVQRDAFGYLRVMEIEPPDAKSVEVDINVLLAMIDRSNMATDYERRMAMAPPGPEEPEGVTEE